MTVKPSAKTATVLLSPQNQNLDHINKVVASIVGKAGCRTCGRLLNLSFQFQVDPDPELVSEGVISVHTEGF